MEMISASVAADSALDRCHVKHEIRSHSARPHQTLGEKLVPPVKSAKPAVAPFQIRELLKLIIVG